MILPKDDAMGQALLAYWQGQREERLWASSDLTEEDEIPLSYLFRDWPKMPEIERCALQKCYGRVLDVGAGSGTHSLWLQEQGHEVVALDTSKGAVEVMKRRGVNVYFQKNFYDFMERPFGTLLFLMNGAGLAGTLAGLSSLLRHARALLEPGGQVLMDSCDIQYMFLEEDGSLWVDVMAEYYGEVTYQMRYRNVLSEPFPWLFVDFFTLRDIANKEGWSCTCLMKDKEYRYLVQLVKV